MNAIMKQYEYHVWANNLIFKHLQQLPSELWNLEIKSVFPSLQAVLSHLYAMDAMWLSVMKGASFDEARALVVKKLEQSSSYTIEQMEKQYESLTFEYRQFIEESDDEQTITIAHPAFGAVSKPLSDLLQHVVNHGTYHRGNISAMLHQIGHKGVATDYMFYIYTLH